MQSAYEFVKRPKCYIRLTGRILLMSDMSHPTWDARMHDSKANRVITTASNALLYIGVEYVTS